MDFPDSAVPAPQPPRAPDLDEELGDADAEESEEPSMRLEALHDEFAAAQTENRRGNKRVMETLKQFGSVLETLSTAVAGIHQTTRGLATAPAPASGAPSVGDQRWQLGLIDLFDRCVRLRDAARQPPASGTTLWPPARRSLAAWSAGWTRHAEALDILLTHVESLLAAANLRRVPTVIGQPFQPATMTAVETVINPARPDHSIAAELLPGWMHAPSGTLLRPTQVRITRAA